jgi:hypothetical protein
MLRRLVTIALIAVMSLHVAPLLAAGGQAAASIAGTARTNAGRTLARTPVRLRNVVTNLIVGTTTSDDDGQFGFVGLQPGTYVVEVLGASGEIIGTSSAIGISAGAAIGGVVVTTAGLIGATAAAGGLSTAAILGIVGAAAAVSAIVVVKNTGSPSR